MSGDMVEQPSVTLQDIVKHVGRYPEEAFVFTREGLGFAADQIHGPETDAHRALQQFLIQNDLDWNDLIARYHTGELPEAVVAAVQAAGGCEKLNRHVGGRELCWGLRDFALQRWSLLARVVLESWNIQSTRDFGRIVFGFIDFDMMRRQEDDTLDDFNDIYSFREAFDEPFRNGLPCEELDSRKN
ncbi:MAG: Minf_1886 family protein [Phycisphaerae bacterium]